MGKSCLILLNGEKESEAKNNDIEKKIEPTWLLDTNSNKTSRTEPRRSVRSKLFVPPCWIGKYCREAFRGTRKIRFLTHSYSQRCVTNAPLVVLNDTTVAARQLIHQWTERISRTFIFPLSVPCWPHKKCCVSWVPRTFWAKRLNRKLINQLFSLQREMKWVRVKWIATAHLWELCHNASNQNKGKFRSSSSLVLHRRS